MRDNNYNLPIFGVNHEDFGMEWANSCVGENGFVDNKQYYDGYIEASVKLMEVILSAEEKNNFETQYWIDTLIYPICFSLRHSIEILLKRISETVIAISTHRGRKENISKIENNTHIHDIGIIWNELRDVAISNDIRYKNPLLRIEPVILEMAKIDPTGQTFRYAYNVDSIKHLTGVNIINIIVLYENTFILKSDMKYLFELNDYLYHEYCLNTFTKNLSRDLIEKLAKDLPLKENWSRELTKEFKTKIMNKYMISSNELTKVINIISKHYEFSSYIGIEVPLQGIEKNDFFEFLELWLKNEHVVNAYNLDIENKLSISELKNIIENEKDSLTYIKPEFIADLYTLNYFADERDGSEQYKYRYKLKYDEYISNETSWKMMFDFEHLLLRKTSLLRNILISITILNQKSLTKLIYSRCSFLQ
ncbi:TPA: hypothetical protein ACHV4L_002557 [Klebsiella variicola]|uniref:hypothetical protein n=1 Tax=Klebsiella aerogenes TaxID=548 RepID=UPI0037718A8E